MRELELRTVASGGTPDGAAEEASAPSSLDAVYRAHAGLVSRWIRRLDPAGDTEDLLHEVFLVVGRRLADFRGQATLTTWLYAVTVRVVVGARRKQKLRLALFGRFSHALESDGPATPEEAAERTRAAGTLYALLDQLSERDRTVLILFELEELSGRELAQILGVAEKNLWTLLHRARARLRTLYMRRYGEKGHG